MKNSNLRPKNILIRECKRETCVVAEEETTYAGSDSQTEDVRITKIRHPSLRVHIQVPWAPRCGWDRQCHLFFLARFRLRRALRSFKQNLQIVPGKFNKKMNKDCDWLETPRLEEDKLGGFGLRSRQGEMLTAQIKPWERKKKYKQIEDVRNVKR